MNRTKEKGVNVRMILNAESIKGTLDACIIEGRKGRMPVKAHPDDAGFDFFAPMDMEEVTLMPGCDTVVQTGVRVAVPKGWALLGVNKSGVATKKKLSLGAKLIDSGYTGELGIHLFNFGIHSVKICPGDKIAQFVMIPIGTAALNELTEEEYWRKYDGSARGSGGFGSTGEK